MQTRYAMSLLFGAAAAGVLVYALSVDGRKSTRAVSPVHSAQDPVAVLPPPTAETFATNAARQDRLVQSEIASLKSQLERMRRDVYAEIQVLRERSVDKPAFENFETEIELDADIDPTKAIKEREETAIDTFADHFDLVLSNEPADSRWRDSHREEVATYFASRGFTSSRIDEFDCSHSLCRIIVSHGGDSDLESFFDLVGEGPLSAGSFYYQTEDGRETVLYVGRPDHEERFHEIMQSAAETIRDS